MSFSIMMSGQHQSKHRLAYTPWLPLVLGVISIITAGVWFHYATLALEDAKLVAALITIPPPPPFSTYLPALLAASLAFIILQAVLVAGLYTWRSLQQYKGDTADPRLDASLTAPTLQRRKPLAIASGVVTALQYGVVLWFVFMLAISFLWYGGGMVAAKATTDAVATMSVVDETFPRLIQNAMGVDPREQGYLVHVNGRDVNIGSSTCSLFCFTLARAMLADDIDCTCNDKLAAQVMPPGNVTADITDPVSCGGAPVMCSINAVAYRMYKQHMKPALVAVVISVLCLLGMLCCVSATHARVKTELCQGSGISRTSSTDADLRISTGSDQGDAKVANVV